MAFTGLYSGRKIVMFSKERGFKITRTQTAKQAYSAIIKKYGEIVPNAKYQHKGKGNWVKYSLKNDKKRTGKTTTDIKKWRKQPHKLDYKGIDTKGSNGKKKQNGNPFDVLITYANSFKGLTPNDIGQIEYEIKRGKIKTKKDINEIANEIKTKNELKKIKRLGNEWTKGNLHRIYFDLYDLYGLKMKYYPQKRGRYDPKPTIRSATLDGKQISNNEAYSIRNMLDSAKVWYDVNTKKIESKNIKENDLKKIKANIKKLI